jgi:hypothetical protein
MGGDGRRRSDAVWAAALAALLLAPHLFTGIDYWHDLPLPGPARIWSGDEPHYLLMVNSLVGDGDLDLSNNYAAVHAGGCQAGEQFARTRVLDHHTCLVLDGRRESWFDFFPPGKTGWEPDPSGALHPVRTDLETPPPVRGPPPPGVPEFCGHQYGIAFLLAPVVWPFRGTCWVEPAALFGSGVAVVLAFFAYRALLRGFTADGFTVNVVSAAAFLGTPVWFYGRSLFLEGWLTCFTVGAYALALRRRSAVLPGVLFGLAMQLKPNYAVVALPLLAEAAARRQWGRLAGLALPMACSAALLPLQYWYLYGSPLTPPQPFLLGDFFDGASGLLANAEVGLVYFSPIAVLAALCWLWFLRRGGAPAAVVGSGFVLFFVLMACYRSWDAGYCYGPRHLTPVLPLLLTSLVVLPVPWRCRTAVGRRPAWGLTAAAGVLLAVSVTVNGAAAFNYNRLWRVNPYVRVYQSLFGPPAGSAEDAVPPRPAASGFPGRPYPVRSTAPPEQGVFAFTATPRPAREGVRRASTRRWRSCRRRPRRRLGGRCPAPSGRSEWPSVSARPAVCSGPCRSFRSRTGTRLASAY